MKLSIKTSLLLIITSILIVLFGALPMIINLDDSFLTPSLIAGSILLIIGIIGIILKAINKNG